MKDRIKQARAARGYSGEQLAELCGVTKGTVSQWESGKTSPTKNNMPLALAALRVDENWLRTGSDPQPDFVLLNEDGEIETIIEVKSTPKKKQKLPPKADHHFIPEIDVRAGMGGGGGLSDYQEGYKNGTNNYGSNGDVYTDQIKANWSIPDGYLRQELNVNPNKVRIIDVDGDSMEPTLRAGDRVMVDFNDVRPRPGIFCVWDGFGIVVKRVETVHGTDRVRLLSDNDRHTPYEVTAEEAKILGRVVWFGRRL